MASPFDPLIDIIHSATTDSWKERNGQALAALFGTRYRKVAEKAVSLRAPEMKGETTRACRMPLTFIRRMRIRALMVA
jgi:hypothetical protein